MHGWIINCPDCGEAVDLSAVSDPKADIPCPFCPAALRLSDDLVARAMVDDGVWVTPSGSYASQSMSLGRLVLRNAVPVGLVIFLLWAALTATNGLPRSAQTPIVVAVLLFGIPAALSLWHRFLEPRLCPAEPAAADETDAACPNCGYRNPKTFPHCAQCGAAMPTR